MLLLCTGRIVAADEGKAWIHQAEHDSKVMEKLFSDGFYSDAVWYASQIVEKGLKAAMFRTCGLTNEELFGQLSHDLPSFYSRLKGADAETAPQIRAQCDLPGNPQDMAWLKTAYIAARYPNAHVRHGKGPSEMYESSDADRAMTLATEVIQWAKAAEDLPFPTPDLSVLVERGIEAAPIAAEFHAPPPESRTPTTPQLMEGPASQPLPEPKAPPLSLRKCKQIQELEQKQIPQGEIEDINLKDTNDTSATGSGGSSSS